MRHLVECAEQGLGEPEAAAVEHANSSPGGFASSAGEPAAGFQSACIFDSKSQSEYVAVDGAYQ